MEVTLPNYFWFTNSIRDNGEHGNIYTGSVGTNPTEGCLMCENLYYKAWVKKISGKDEEEQFSFFAQSWFRTAWTPGKGKEAVDFEERTFPNEEESVEKIKEWLRERAKRLEK